MSSRSDIPRAIIVQDEGITGDSVIRVAAVADPSDTQEAGISVQQPARDTTLVGDIRPTLSGTAERASAGDISVAMAGAEGNMRWGFVQDGASESADFQFRQSPTVCGRRPDTLQYSTEAAGHFWAPTLVPLISGNLLAMWMVQDVPFHARDYTAGWTTGFRRNVCGADDCKWSATNDTVSLGDFGFVGENIGGGPYWVDMDITQYPDTGELVCLLIGTAVSTGTVYDSSITPIPVGGSILIGACFSSTDEGLTWEQRSKIFFYAAAGVAVFPSLYPLGSPTNFGQARCVSIETTRSGRLIAFVGAEFGAFNLVSDDRGRSWQGGSFLTNLFTGAESADTPPEEGAPHESSSMRRLRDGMVMCIHNVSARAPGGMVPPVMPSVWLTVDGITWTDIGSGMQPWPFVGRPTYTDVAVVQRPDGYPAFYATLHADVFQGEIEVLAEFDEFVTLPFVQRDVAPGDDATGYGSPVLPFGATGVHFHMLHDAGRQGADVPNVPAGDLASYTDNPPLIDGFGGVAVVTWRGQLVLMAAMMNEINDTDAVFVHRLDHFQPIQERLDPNVSDIAVSTIATSDRWIAGYGRTWDAYDDPANWGYTLVQTGGTSAMQAPNNAGGYWESAVVGAQRYWSDPTLPWPELNHNGVLRVVMQAKAGGDVDNPFMVVHLILQDMNQFVDVELRMEVVGSDVVYQLHDVSGIVNIGGPLTLPGAANQFVEILLATWKLDDATNPTNVTAYVRAYDPTTDPDLLAGYSLIATGTLTETSGGLGVERVEFGHRDLASVAEARWKTVQLWRDKDSGTDAFLEYAPLGQAGITYVDDDARNVRYDAALIIEGPDVGFQNFMRAAQGIAYPAQFFADGLNAEWRGEAAVEGVIPYATQFLYGARYLFDKSTPQREWRSRNSFENIEIVLDAEVEGGAGALFNPRAIAVVGRNWPICSIQFSNDDFTTIPLSFSAGIPGLITAYNRNTHLLAFTAGAGTTIGVGAYRVRVRTPRSNARGGQTFWPNRFRSQVGGARFYIAITDTSTPHVYEIADNDKDTLYLKTDLVAAGITEINEFCIFSDRFAWDFSYLMPDGDQGYRYMRLLLPLCIHGDEADSFFYRCGSIILGQPVPFPAGIEWGYRVALAPGATTSFAITGAGYSTRNSAMRREWSVDGPVMRPPNEPETVEAMDIDQAVASWRKVSDMTRRVEANGEPCALIMDATRYEGDASEDGEQLLADPYDLAIVRATGVGNINHEAYMCREIPALDGTGDLVGVPKEVNVVAQIVFTEQL